MNQPTLILLYHFFHPDDVISARLYSDLAEWAHREGWHVIAMPSVRSCHDGSKRLPKSERWNGVHISRVWRPAWKQASTKGRLGNTLFMLLAWSWRALITPRTTRECVVIGTDPPMGVLAAIPWRVFRPQTRIVHWCHDVYPQAAIAEGMLNKNSLLIRALNTLLRFAYARCDAVVDLGVCMRGLLKEAIGERDAERMLWDTLTPWSLVEPETMPVARPSVRDELFGSTAKLGLMYSGNLGRAHAFQPFVDLARKLRSTDIEFCYAGRGPRIDELKQQLNDSDRNCHFAGFASEEQLAERLSAADIHLVSLQPNWTGCVVPSKFFGALAVGRPILYAGGRDSVIAQWIEQYEVGWVLENDQDIDRVAQQLLELSKEPKQLAELQSRCQRVYRERFSKSVQLLGWQQLLQNVFSAPRNGITHPPT